MICAPDASVAPTVIVDVPSTPEGSDDGLALSEIDETTGSNVTSTSFVVPPAIVATAEPVDSSVSGEMRSPP